MPFLDAARALITAGHDADAILEMYRIVMGTCAHRSKLLPS
ncbi:MAG: hypothetical protein WBE29_04180 [Pseudolabrys sp.]